jgi:hypothetical protein
LFCFYLVDLNIKKYKYFAVDMFFDAISEILFFLAYVDDFDEVDLLSLESAEKVESINTEGMIFSAL